MPLDRRSIVASWQVTFPEGDFLIEFEHGTTSGKRVIWINGKEIFRKDWMFRLVGAEIFHIGRFECKIDVEPDGAFGLNYWLDVDGQRVEQFREAYRKKHTTWTVNVKNAGNYRVVLEKETMDVWLNGKKTESNVKFLDGGSIMEFHINGKPVSIKSLSSGNKKEGMLYQFLVEDEVLQPDAA